MTKSLLPYVLIALPWMAGSITPALGDGWPAKVFAPYMYVGAGDNFKLTDCFDQCGQKYYTLAFIISDEQKKGVPAWDGQFSMESNFYAEQIQGIRSHGGDVIVSFGGEGGSELALEDKDAASLQAKYQSIIDRYKFTWLDFDIEGKALVDEDANRRRNTAIAGLQAKNPGLIISFTLPVDPDGISTFAERLLSDAKAKGVKIHSANVMTMDFGKQFAQGKKESAVSIASVLKAYEQTQAIDPNIQIGITPDIGRNDERAEIFSLDDAKILRDWALAHPWVCSLSFWSSNRDNSEHTRDDNTSSSYPQKKWDFTKTFQPFTSP